MAKIGNTSLDVFPLCLGGNVFGWTIDEAQSFAVLDAYAAAGGNFVDTADMYSSWVPGNAGRRVGDDPRPVDGRPGQPRPDRSSRRRWESSQGLDRPLGEDDPRGGRELAPPARDRPHRPLLRPRRRPGDAPRGDARSVRRARPRGEGPSRRGLQLHRAASLRGARRLEARRAGPLRGAPAALQPRPPGRVRGRARRLCASARGSPASPTTRSPAASSPASTVPA